MAPLRALLAAVLAILLLPGWVAAETGPRAPGPLAVGPPAPGPLTVGPPAPFARGILVNIAARTLYWYEEGRLVRAFPVAAGKPATPTPVGSFQVESRAVDPWWLPPWGGAAVAPGPANPLGTRWLGFHGGYGIHGTNDPPSIGQLVSLGCIRMQNRDAEWLHAQVRVGTPVRVVYETALIEADRHGRRYLGLYPDTYGRGGKGAYEVLAEAGLAPDLLPPDLLPLELLPPDLLPPKRSSPVRLLLEVEAYVRGRPIPAILHQGRPYVAAEQLGAALGLEVRLGRGLAAVRGQSLPTVPRAGQAYLDAEAAAALLGLAYEWAPADGLAWLSGPLRPLTGAPPDG